jgi:hypothetical protein
MSVSSLALTQTVREQNQRLARLHRDTPAELADSAQ